MLLSLWEKTAARTGAINATSSALTNNFLVNAQSVKLWHNFARRGFFFLRNNYATWTGAIPKRNPCLIAPSIGRRLLPQALRLRFCIGFSFRLLNAKRQANKRVF